MGKDLGCIKMTPFSTLDWHQRYIQQASWTSQLRNYLLQKAGLSMTAYVLEVGSGTGAILLDMAPRYSHVHGLDIFLPNLLLAQDLCPTSLLIQGDAHRLPYCEQQFDLVYCHYLLLWVKSAEQTLREMVRVTKPGGVVIAMAEPDYGGRIDYPAELEKLGELQVKALRNQGADTFMGRKLASLFSKVGLVNIEIGVIGGQWQVPDKSQNGLAEWEILEDDLKDLVTLQDLSNFKNIIAQSLHTGERVLFIPTFYAWGQKGV